jgi:hypothetical protein
VLLAVIGVRTPRVFQVLVYGYAALSFTTPCYVGIDDRVTRHHHRLPAGAGDAVPAAAAISASKEATHADARGWGIASPHNAGTRTAADVADHSPADSTQA